MTKIITHKSVKKSGFLGLNFFLLSLLIIMSSNVYAQYTLINANNNGQVYQQTAPAGIGDVTDIRNKLFDAGLPNSVVNTRLTQGVFASNIAETEAMIETATALANRPATYTGTGTIITSSNFEDQRSAIAEDGGTFIFRGTVNLNSGDELIKIGPNTTIWIDGTVNYSGPVIPAQDPNEFSVGDVIRGVFEVTGTNGDNSIDNVKIFGTKRGVVNGNKRVAGIYTKWATDLVVEGVNFLTSRNVIFINNTHGLNSRIEANYIYNSARRAIHLKASNNTLLKNNLIVNAAVDGIDMDAFVDGTKCIKNVVFNGGSRYQYWTEIAAKNCVTDGNIGIHLRNGDGGFQENGSEPSRPEIPPTQNNSWINNHVFYADAANNFRQGFSINPRRKVDRPSITLRDNIVWSTNPNSYKNNGKIDDLSILDDIYYHLYNPNGTNTVSIASSPASVAPGESVNVSIDYVSAGQNEVVAIVTSPTGTWLNNDKQTVSGGSGTVNLSVDQLTNWPLESNYKLEVLIRPVGSSYNDRLDLKATTFNVENPITNSVIIASSPASVAPGENVNVSIDYSSAGQNEVVAIVTSPTGTWLNNAKQTVSEGSGTVNLSVDQLTNWTVGNDYKLEVLIRPVGSSYNDRLDLKATTFSVANTNSVTIVDSPVSVAPGENVNLIVDYATSGQNEVVAIVTSPTGTWLNNTKQTVSEGSTISMSVNQPTNWPVGNNYKLEVLIRPVGTSYNERFDLKETTFNVENTVSSASSARVDSKITSKAAKTNLMYPNPIHNGRLTIDVTGVDKNTLVSVYDVRGAIVAQRRVKADKMYFDSAIFQSKGMFIVRVHGTDSKDPVILKLIVM